MYSRARAIALVAAFVVLAAALGGCGKSDATTTTATAPAALRLGPAFGPMTDLPDVQTGPPPWSANRERLQQRLLAIPLDPLSEEGQVQHTHQHLDLFVDGNPVLVPAQIGIGPENTFISALHTHDPSGIMHVESPVPETFTLGQFFAVWGVRLDARCVGGRCASGAAQLRTWVNGKPVPGDPTRIVLDEHLEIVLAFGTAAQAPDPVPSRYDFAAVGL